MNMTIILNSEKTGFVYDKREVRYLVHYGDGSLADGSPAEGGYQGWFVYMRENVD